MSYLHVIIPGGSKATRQRIRDVLNSSGLAVETTFLEDLNRLDDLQGDFVLLPWDQENSIALLERLRQAHPNTPVFLLTRDNGSPPELPCKIAGTIPEHALENLAKVLRPHLEARRLEDLHRLVKELDALKGVSEALQFLPKAVAHLLNADGSIIALRDSQDHTVIHPVGHNLPADYTKTSISRGEGLVWHTLLKRETLMLDDYSAHPEALPKGKAAGFRSLLSVPLLAGNAVIGSLAVFRKRVHPFTSYDRMLLETLGVLAGARMNDMRLSATLLQQATELSLLHSLSTIATEATTVDELLQRTTNLIHQHFLPSNCGILLVDRARNALIPHCTYRDHPDTAFPESVPIGTGVTGRVVLTDRSERIDDVRECDYYLEVDPSVRSELCVPIHIQGKVIGVINLESTHRAAFSPTDQALLESVARQLASNVEKLRLLEEERNRRRLAESLHAATTSLISSLELDHVLNTILHLLKQVVSMDSGSVQLIEGDMLRTAAVIGFEHPERLLGAHNPLNSPILLEVTRRREPVILEDASSHPGFDNWVDEYPIRGWMCAPLIARGEVIGFLTLDSRQPHTFRAIDAALVQTFANEAALAIHNARLFQESRQRTRELSTLYATMLALSASLDQRDLLSNLEKQVREHIAPDGLLLLSLEGEYQATVLHASIQGKHIPDWVGQTISTDTFHPLAWVQQSGQLLITRDLEQPPLLGMASERDERVRAWVGLPLRVGDRVQGILVMEFFEAGQLDRYNPEFLQAFANQVAVMLEHTRLYQRALQDAEHWAVLHWAGQEINRAGLDLERVYTAVHQAARRLMDCDAFAITQYHAEGKEVEGVYLVDLGRRVPTFRSPAEHTLTWQVVQRGKALCIGDLTAYPQMISCARFGTEQPVRSVIAVPMRLGNRIIGMISAQSYRPNAYSDDDAVRLEMLAAQAVVAIENAQLYTTIERRALHLLTAAEVARDAAVLDEVDTLLQRAVNLVRDRFGFYHAGIFLTDERREYAVLRAATGRVGQQMVRQGHRLKIGQTGIVGYVTYTGKPRIADDVDLDQVHYKNPLLPYTRAEMAVPLRVGREVIGALDVQSRRENAFSAEDVAVLQTLADQIAVAIRNAQLYQRERQRRRAMEALRRASLRLTASLDLEHVTQTILEQAMELSQAWDVHLFLYNGEELTFAGARWREPEHSPPFIQPRKESITYTVARSGQPLIIHDMQSSELYAKTDWEGAIASLPLKIGEQVRGVLNVAFNKPHVFSEEEVQLLQLLSDQAAIALENAHLYRELEQGYIDTILALGRTVNARDAYTADHSHDLTELAVATAQEMGCDEQTITNTRWAALLHDIGKIGIPDSILNKPGPLTVEERAIIEQHPDIGADIVAPIKRLAHLAPIIRTHQEKYDGSGYPRGLKGEEIPLEARIVAVVDAYSAMIDERVYKQGKSPESAVAELQRCAGTHFDPQVVDAFIQVLKKRNIA